MSEKIFYSIPFRAEQLVQKKLDEPAARLEKCDVKKSIDQNVRLLLMTPPQRVRGAFQYGCKVHWLQHAASNQVMKPYSRAELDVKSRLNDNIKGLVERFEPRLEHSKTDIQVGYADKKGTWWEEKRYRNTQSDVIQLKVTIKGTISNQFVHNESLEWKKAISLL
jgi:phage baseplate assembly protein W